MKKAPRTCLDCPKVISHQSKKGRCHPCAMKAMHNDPEFQAKRTAALKKRFDNDPDERKRAAARLQKWRENMTDADRARLREHGKRLARDVLSKPEVIAKAQSPAARARAAAGNEKAKLGWCPPERRTAYMQLLRGKRYSAAEARAIIEEEMRVEAERNQLSLSARIAASHDKMKRGAGHNPHSQAKR